MDSLLCCLVSFIHSASETCQTYYETFSSFLYIYTHLLCIREYDFIVCLQARDLFNEQMSNAKTVLIKSGNLPTRICTE